MSARVALYARYSSDLQRDASIEDQLRVCREYAAKQGWTVVDSYSDRAMSGASMLRPGLQELLADAGRGRFDIILAEGLDRLSRDQEDTARIFKQLTFLGIKLCTIADGEVNEMHVGLKSTLNTLYLKDLADKTRRGLRGRVETGKAASGISYGYAVKRGFNADGTPSTGEREIVAAEAEVVRRIFREFAAGKSPRQIAVELNQAGIAAPGGKGWGQSTINGNAERGTGILNNELYVGRLVWNRLRYLKDPSTGKRVSRPNSPEQLISKEVPELRIVDDELWQAAKARQAEARKRGFPKASRAETEDAPATKTRFWSNQRPKHLLTGLMRCGVCGGGYHKISATLFGCAAARNKGTCDNRLNIKVERLDEIVLAGLKGRLMNPEIYQEFLAAYIAERNTILAQRNAQYTGAEAELRKLKARQKVLVQAVADGLPARTVKDEMIALEAREDELHALLASRPEAEPSLHPNLATIYREKVAALHEALADPATKDEAFNIIRTLIDEVRLVPEDGQLRVEIRGALAGILALSVQNDKTARVHPDGSVSVLVEQMKLVAGARFELTTFRL
ncbi:recombinase family protein [Acidocella aromatica]|uniref:recombinase family protein n=1 Tax=Acidocella aromatica TaxID=1303579 RepID=UPI001605896F|nr:recombinase family protein [Acidocella aromatica]